MMNCEEIRRLTHDYLDKELDQASVPSFLEHLHACQPCFTHAEFQRILKQILFKLSHEVAVESSFRKKIIASLRAGVPSEA